MPPSLINPPQGCKFRPRCPHAFDKCMEEPELVARVEKSNHLDRCWLTPETKRAVRDKTIEGEIRAA
jgi:ABC-type dipeptide/oligopeptide/nickel transport system ATPase component